MPTQKRAADVADIEYFYSSHSAFAYLGSARLMEIATAGGHRIVHRPINLQPVVVAAGAGSTRERTPQHRAYYFGREIIRWSEQRDAPVVEGMPTHHFNDTTLANCTLIAAQCAGDNVDQLAHAILQAHWRDDADLADASTLRRLADGVGADGEALLIAARTKAMREQHESNVQQAIDRSVFGSPTYFVDGDMFYGQDRLEMVERALVQPYRR
jgi:2-hydroxychromene-2-carboxylate isomerase